MDATVTIIASLGGLTLERTVAWRQRVRVRRAMLAELRAALREHAELRPRVDTVHGGTLDYRDDGDVGDRRALGFTCRR